MSFNLSELLERVVNTVPDREALVSPNRRLTYRQLDERTNRIAHYLASQGVGPGDHVGLQLLNGTEYVEAMLAAYKLRAVPVNVNYRYVERELAYLYENADLVALFANRQFLPTVKEALPSSSIHLLVVVQEDGGDKASLAGESSEDLRTLQTVAMPPGRTPPKVAEYEAALAESSPEADFQGRSSEDLYLAYTGGTTGMPKGVMWYHKDIFFAALGGGDPLLDKGPIKSPDELPDRVAEFPLVHLCCPPLMHVSATWGAFNAWYGGGKVVLLGPGTFSPAQAWRAVQDEKVNALTVVGDAMARPLLDELEHGAEIDTSSLIVFSSGGATLSVPTKEQIGRLLPNAIIIDAFGSSETGLAGSRSNAQGQEEVARFTVDQNTVVLDEDMRPVPAGSDAVGRLARRGHVPLGYYKDEAKTAATFVEVEGHRWVLSGDMATVDHDGTVVLLGRDSGCINTGGEKVFVEEVEAVLKNHPDIYDVVVVGTSDERWGQRVVAVVQARAGHAPSLESVQEVARQELAGYKIPREVKVVHQIQRAPNGKPDYEWARRQVAGDREETAVGSTGK